MAVVLLDDHRPKVYEALKCLFCGTEQEGRPVVKDRDYHDCPGCDEVASIPKWQWIYGR